jgi:hypothetical protein
VFASLRRRPFLAPDSQISGKQLHVTHFINALGALTFPEQRASCIGMSEKNPQKPVAAAERAMPISDETAPPRAAVGSAAQRALAEAQGRRAEIDRKAAEQPKELHGRNGPDPARYGDWEVKGIASDF